MIILTRLLLKTNIVSKLHDLVTATVSEVVFDIYPSPGSGSDTVPPFDLRFTTVTDANSFKSSAFKKVDPAVLGHVQFHPKILQSS